MQYRVGALATALTVADESFEYHDSQQLTNPLDLYKKWALWGLFERTLGRSLGKAVICVRKVTNEGYVCPLGI